MEKGIGYRVRGLTDRLGGSSVRNFYFGEKISKCNVWTITPFLNSAAAAEFDFFGQNHRFWPGL